MIATLDDNTLPLFKRIKIEREDAIATNRGQNGTFNADRSYAKDRYILEYDFFDVSDYNTVKTLYEAQFSTGQFFRFQLVDSGMPINEAVYIAPSSIVPRFAGSTLEGYSLTLIQK
jgi:hypothetical protein